MVDKLESNASEESNDAASRPAAQAAPPRLTERVNRWLTLGVNLGVVVGLIILTIEVRQNAALTRVDMELRTNDLLAQIELSLANPGVSHAWVKSIRAPETMTDIEVRKVESHLAALILQWDHMLNMEDGGLVSRQRIRRHIENTAPYYLGSRLEKIWWRWQEAGWNGTPMYDMADPIIKSLDEHFMLNYLNGSRLGSAESQPANPPVVEEAP